MQLQGEFVVTFKHEYPSGIDMDLNCLWVVTFWNENRILRVHGSLILVFVSSDAFKCSAIGAEPQHSRALACSSFAKQRMQELNFGAAVSEALKASNSREKARSMLKI